MISLRFGIYLAIILTGVVIGLFRYKKLVIESKFLTILLLLTFISECISRVLATTIENANPAYHFYSPIEYTLWALIFYNITKSRKIKIACLVSIPIMALFSIINSIYLQPLMVLNSNFDVVKTLITSFFAVTILLEIMNRPMKGAQLFSYDIIILIAVFWFNLASFVFFASHNYFVRNNMSGPWLYDLHFISNIVYYSMLLWAQLKSAYNGRKPI